MSYPLACYNAAWYESHKDARHCDALYVTGSCIDALASRSGLYDVKDIVDTIIKMIGITDEYTFGIIHRDMFIPLHIIEHSINLNDSVEYIEDVLEAWSS